MVKVKVRKEYWLEGGCHGKITICLPMKDGHIIPEFGDSGEDIKVMGEQLHSMWGWIPDYPHRCKSKKVSGSSWEEVREKLNEVEEKSIDALYKALDRYKELEAGKPQDEEYEVVLR